MIFMAVVLQILKHAQMQNGLRHRDYTRYRYCWNLMIEMWCFEWILVFCRIFFIFVLLRIFFLNFRRYCTARLRRLYKSLRFTHGRGKFTRRVITDSTVSDVRFVVQSIICHFITNLRNDFTTSLSIFLR